MGVSEIVGFVTGAVCVWLAVRQNIWTYPIGIVNNVAFAVLFLGSGLYAGAGLQVVYLGLAGLSWYWWVRGGSGHTPLPVRRTPAAGWVAAAVGVVAATVALRVVLATWTDSPAPTADALTTALSLAAQLMMGRKWLGNWAVWIVADVIFVGLYASQGLWLTAALYAGFIGLCVQGARTWRRDLGATATADPAESADQANPTDPADPTAADAVPARA
ncbi:nicotinamide riboside transporter PnuC [Pengzhenrongella sicca]|uniref:Nicotinamide mononucleotide transporter n=1 Tax=Pengzhenrongella sicca TaxID=2819238 RepID=A0A8A4ZIQ7_9MICO|nr:nicotinamide riboside transporter PnuC [Pengzhenrongella sicca]QTE30903.1 nicotinamide mononucleotide transporter [Pengzhenrongella sicca]